VAFRLAALFCLATLTVVAAILPARPVLPDANPGQAAEPAEDYFDGLVGHRTDESLSTELFFRHAGDAETRSRAIADPPSALPQLPYADGNGYRHARA
jgi:hypothetical protein